MDRRFTFALVAALPLAMLALPATGDAAPAKRRPAAPASRPKPQPAPLGDTVRIAIVTEKGTITVDLDHARAPRTVANFVRYVDARRYDGMTFYRSMHLAWGDPPNGLIQAGLQGDPRKLFAPIPHEPTSQTGILHKAGTLSMARWAPGTATADFSIMLSPQPGLDADPSSPDPDRQAGFAAFGQVVSGMDVVRAIWEAPRSPTAGEGVMKGQLLAPPIKVLTVRRIALPAPASAPAPSAPPPAPPQP